MVSFSELGIEERAGTARYVTTCPECSSTRKKKDDKCLTVNNEAGNRWWHCNHTECGWKGNLEVYEKYEKVKVAAHLPENIGQIKAYSKEVSAYLHKRGFTTATCLKEEIYEPVGSKNLIAFPFFISQTIVNIKFLNLKPYKGKPKWFQLPRSTNSISCFMGLANLELDKNPRREKKNYVIICEGEADWLTWKECGYRNVLSVPQGAPSETAKDFTKEFAYVNEKYFQSILPLIDVFYLSTDEDGPGTKLRDHLALLLGKERCRVIKYPHGYKDINEVLAGHEEKELKAVGRDAVKQCFVDASTFPIKGIIKPSDLRYKLMELSEGGLVPGIGTGVPEFDYLMTFKRQHISFWTGIPGMGKSVTLRWVMVKLIQNNPDLNLKFALFTPENRPVEREVVMISQVLTGKQFKKGQWNSMSDEQRRKALNFIEKHFFIVAPGPRNYESFGDKIKAEQVNTLDALLEYFAYLAKTEGIFGYVIDAYNKIQHQVPRGLSETTYIEQQLDKMLDFNTYYNCHGFIVAHPTKQELNKKTGRYEMPSLYDVKGSSSWNERADIGVIIHRNIWRPLSQQEQEGQDDEDDRNYVARYDAPTIIKTDKIRFEETGNRDMVRLVMDPTGGFRVYEKDKDMHVAKIRKKMDAEEEQRMAEVARAQQTIPDFIDVEEDNSPLPF